MKYINFQDQSDYCNCYERKFCFQKSDDFIDFFTLMAVFRSGKIILRFLRSYSFYSILACFHRHLFQISIHPMFIWCMVDLRIT